MLAWNPRKTIVRDKAKWLIFFPNQKKKREKLLIEIADPITNYSQTWDIVTINVVMQTLDLLSDHCRNHYVSLNTCQRRLVYSYQWIF